MKKIVFVLGAIIMVIGCARVSVQGSKEPIKLDISMRLDIYQHVQKDIDAIEGIVSGSKNASVEKQSFLNLFVSNAYAQGGLDPEVEGAALRRKSRTTELYALEKNGIVGENKMGLVEVRDASRADASVKQIIKAENSDRMVIYKSLASGNNISVEEMQKLYSKRLYKDAPSGTPIQELNESTGAYEWRKK
ncbi:MAG: DUF1318 domain-containing protein [Candidatus Omnitrophota bacterium]